MVIAGPVIPDQSGCQVGFGEGDMCIVEGAAGGYQVTLSAPGYQPSVVSFNAPQPKLGPCECQEFDTQTISVVMQPATD
jgi:hypothetical protein